MAKFMHISRKEVDQYYRSILQSMHNGLYMPDVVMGLSRGGLDMGVRFSHYFNCPFVPLVWQTRDGKGKDIDTLKYTLNKYMYKNILITDDISDSGETLETLFDEIADCSNISTAVLVENIDNDFQTNWSGMTISRETDDCWIVFPWEKI